MVQRTWHYSLMRSPDLCDIFGIKWYRILTAWMHRWEFCREECDAIWPATTKIPVEDFWDLHSFTLQWRQKKVSYPAQVMCTTSQQSTYLCIIYVLRWNHGTSSLLCHVSLLYEVESIYHYPWWYVFHPFFLFVPLFIVVLVSIEYGCSDKRQRALNLSEIVK